MRRIQRFWAIFLAIAGFGISLLAWPASAEPTADEIAPPLPVVVPVASGWQPKFPYPYDETRNEVTDADVTASARCASGTRHNTIC